MKKIKSRKVLWQIIMSYLMLSVVFVIACLAFYRISAGRLRAEIQENSYNALKMMELEVDEKAQLMQAICREIYTDNEILLSIQAEVSGRMSQYDTFKFKSKLATFFEKETADIFITFPGRNRVVSGRYSPGSTYAYYRCYYQNGGTGFDEWMQALTSRSAGVGISTETVKGQGILFSMPYPAYRKNPDAIISVLLSPDAVSRIIDNVPNGIFLIYNDEGGFAEHQDGSGSVPSVVEHKGGSRSAPTVVLVSADHPDLANLPIDTSRSQYSGSFNGQQYVIQTSNSEKSGFGYVHMIPESIFWSKQQVFFHTMLAAIAVFGLVVLVLIALLTWNNYKPWRRLLSFLHEEHEERPEAAYQSESEYIKEVLNSVISEKQHLHNRLEKNAELKINHVMLKYLLHGETPEEFREMLAETKVFQPESAFLLVKLIIKSWDSEKAAAVRTPEFMTRFKTEVQYLFENMVGDFGHSLVFAWDKRSCLAVLELAETGPGQTASLFSPVLQIQHMLSRRMGINAFVAVSGAAGDYMELPKVYQEIICCEEYQTVSGRDAVVFYEQIKTRKYCYRGSQEVITNQIKGFLAEEEGTLNAAKLVEGLVKQALDDSRADVNTYKDTRRGLLKGYETAIRELAILAGWMQETTEKLKMTDSFVEFKISFSELLENTRAYTKTVKRDKDVLDELVDYITQNYNNSDLNLNFLAEQFRMSSQYLSKMFKNRYEIGIVDFIAGIRIGNAKEKLRQTSKSIETIAAETGFLSSTSFIRTFKKVTGTTPGKYRSG